jgi:hypothetical protein
MEGEIVLWKNRKRLDSAGDNVLCLTFLTTQHHLWTLVPLIIRTYCRILRSFPSTKFYSLKQYRNDEWRPCKTVKEMPGFELTMSLLDPLTVKRICISLERNSKGQRRADIDVHVFNRREKMLYKVSRYEFLELLL